MNLKNSLHIILGLIVTACANGQKTNAVTDKFENGKPLAELKDKKLKEVSGLAKSITNSDMLWAHNDSGNDAEIFLIDENLNIKLTCYLNGIENRDWEDITIGPGPDSSKTYIYVGDIGDNDAVYPYKYVYRFEEPTFHEGQKTIVISDVDVITFRLSDKVKDTESLLIDPQTKNLYIVSKREDPVFLYELKFPYLPNDTITASRIMSLPLTKIVAADYYSQRGDVLMKNYKNIYYWENTNGEDIITLLKKQPMEVPYEEEPQGEALTWTKDGSGFYTLSEKSKGKESFLYFYSLKKQF